MKAYTDVDQSKKLAEFLSIESADMYYEFDFDLNMNVKWSLYPNVIKENKHFELHSNDIPCWSLAVLLSIIPKHIKDYNVFRIDIGDNNFSVWYDEIGFGVNSDLPNITMKEPIDACVEMIIKLHEQNTL